MKRYDKFSKIWKKYGKNMENSTKKNDGYQKKRKPPALQPRAFFVELYF